MSARGLEAAVGFGSYQTAWAWLHKLRRAMVRSGRDRLSGVVEVDETYVGGVEPDVSGRQTARKAIVAIAVEVRGNAMGRVRLVRVPNAGKVALHRFVGDTVEPGSTLHTDAWKGYDGIEHLGYTRNAVNLSASPDPAHVVMPHVHRIASLLKRWWIGTHQGAIRRPHLDFYLDEFAFRFNRRGSIARGLLFYRLMEQAVALDHTPYARLLGGKETKRPGPKRKAPAVRRPARRVSVSLPLGAKSPPGGRWSGNRVALTRPARTSEPPTTGSEPHRG